MSKKKKKFVLFFKNLSIEYICRLDILNAEDRKQQ